MFGTLLPENFIGIKRHLDERNQWLADYHYASFEAPCRTVLVGDTVASGASVSQGIRAFAEWGKAHGLEQVHFFSACGSRVGGQRIRQTCVDLGLKATFTHGLAAFGMAEHGWKLPDTDLPWLHPDTHHAAPLPPAGRDRLPAQAGVRHRRLGHALQKPESLPA